MQLAEIWRYPIKSMSGERLDRVTVGPLGLEGDRVVHVENARGRVVTARTHPLLLGHKGTWPLPSRAGLKACATSRAGLKACATSRAGLKAWATSRAGLKACATCDGEPLVDGRPWTDPGVLADIERIVGSGARLVRDDTAKRFDVLPLLVATDGAIAAFGYDGRRLRPNFVIGGVQGLDERTWEGCKLRIGAVTLRLEKLRARCVMTTFDPDTLEQDRGVLESIVERFDGTLALNAAVEHAGTVRVGDDVEITR